MAIHQQGSIPTLGRSMPDLPSQWLVWGPLVAVEYGSVNQTGGASARFFPVRPTRVEEPVDRHKVFRCNRLRCVASQRQELILAHSCYWA